MSATEIELPHNVTLEDEITAMEKYIHFLDSEIKWVIDRTYLVRKTLGAVIITISLLFLSSFFVLMSRYAFVFWWISIITIMLGKKIN